MRKLISADQLKGRGTEEHISACSRQLSAVTRSKSRISRAPCRSPLKTLLVIVGNRKASRSPLRITLGCKSSRRAKSSIELQVPSERHLSQSCARTMACASNGLGDAQGMIGATLVSLSTIAVRLFYKGNLDRGCLDVAGTFQRYRKVLGMHNDPAYVFFCALSRCETVTIQLGSDSLEHCGLNLPG